MLSRLRINSAFQIRWFSGKVKFKIDENVNALLEKKELKPRKHPGIMHPGNISMPQNIVDAISNMLEDYSAKQLIKDSITLRNHLQGRHPPCESNIYKQMYQQIQDSYMKDTIMKDLSMEEIENLRKKNHKKAMNYLKQKIHVWSPTNYDQYKSLLYLIGRGIQDYAVLYKIFYEIQLRDKDFSPNMILDFGSGVGTVLWAAMTIWKKPLEEYFCVDISNDMIDLSEQIMKYAFPNLKNIFFRQYLPASLQPHYDLTVSAYTLLELPNVQERVNTIYKLWRKTSKYLILVEHGTNSGFNVINEAREFILYSSKMTKNENRYDTHIFSPCPHDRDCPRVAADDGTPCNFETIYNTLPLVQPLERKNEFYSYIVFKKESRNNDDNWPRIIRPVLLRSKHTICRMCTSSGKLEEAIITKHRHGKYLNRCAKLSDWGDRLPIKIEDVTEEKYNTEYPSDLEYPLPE